MKREALLILLMSFCSLCIKAQQRDLENEIVNRWDSVVAAHAADTIEFSDGGLYIGQTADSVFSGIGRMTYADGTVYTGDWKDHMWNGYGLLFYPDGDCYEGQFRDNMLDGEGTYTYADGAIYKGHLKESRFEGIGRLIYSDGGIYHGNWENDMREGFGILVSSREGDIYSGYFHNDEYYGDRPYVKDESENVNTSGTDSNTDDSWVEPIFEINNIYSSNFFYTMGLWFSRGNGKSSWGFEASLRTNTPYEGIDMDYAMIQYDIEKQSTGWYDYAVDEMYYGTFNSATFNLVYAREYKKRIQVGGRIGIGIRTEYKNCKNVGDINSLPYVDRGEYYYKTRTKGARVNYGAICKYILPFKDYTDVTFSTSLSRIEGLGIGVGIRF